MYIINTNIKLLIPCIASSRITQDVVETKPTESNYVDKKTTKTATEESGGNFNTVVNSLIRHMFKKMSTRRNLVPRLSERGCAIRRLTTSHLYHNELLCSLSVNFIKQ